MYDIWSTVFKYFKKNILNIKWMHAQVNIVEFIHDKTMLMYGHVLLKVAGRLLLKFFNDMWMKMNEAMMYV